MAPVTTRRSRDPARKERILSAAAGLIARDGFTAVSMEDIGDAVGITASAIYRHYDSKHAVLVAMLDRVVDKLLADGRAIASAGLAEPGAALARLVDAYIDFVLGDRAVAQVYFRELAQVRPDDRRRLRRNQRLYVEEWVLLLTELRPGLDDATARGLVHAAIGTLQSTLWYSTALPEPRLRALLQDAARGVLEITPYQSPGG
ncbi:MAG TPA: TetR/AcrR family transcriptional regulator [Trebonia sp.]|jgi:AcrR family transcriptional regulator|nr:TetR/AcrR family transcriptional regulator [Trebonia sp.]